MKINGQEFDIEEFRRFLGEVKRKNYRRDGKFYFSRETYSDRELEFVGLLDGGRIWQMEIRGRMLLGYEGDEELKERVEEAMDEISFRAVPIIHLEVPQWKIVRMGDLLCYLRTTGDIDNFEGVGQMFQETSPGGGCNKVYKLEYGGGFRERK